MSHKVCTSNLCQKGIAEIYMPIKSISYAKSSGAYNRHNSTLRFDFNVQNPLETTHVTKSSLYRIEDKINIEHTTKIGFKCPLGVFKSVQTFLLVTKGM